jgi:hypothetical protein
MSAFSPDVNIPGKVCHSLTSAPPTSSNSRKIRILSFTQYKSRDTSVGIAIGYVLNALLCSGYRGSISGGIAVRT